MSVFITALIGFCVITSELYLIRFFNHAFADLLTFTHPIIVFSCISLGTFIFHQLKSIELKTLFWIQAILANFSFTLIWAHPTLGIISPLAFLVIWGTMLATMYARFPLRSIVIGGCLGSGVAVLLFSAIYVHFSVPIALSAACLVGAIVLSRSKGRVLILGLALFTTSIYMEKNSLYDFPSFIKTYLSTAKNLDEIYQHKSGLIDTAVLANKEMTRAMITTNGSRYAHVYSAKDVATFKQQETMPTMIAAPYYLTQPKKVLIIGVGGGQNTIAANLHGVEMIHALDINPQVFVIAESILQDYTGFSFDTPKIKKIVSEGREFLENTEETYDLIVVQATHTGTLLSGQSPVAIESSLYTYESVARALTHLRDGGILYFVTYRMQLPGTGTILESIGSTLLKRGIVRNEQNILHFSGPQNKRKKFEGLFVAKNRSVDWTKLQTYLSSKQMRMTNLADMANTAPISDDRPLFMSPSLRRPFKSFNLAALCLLLVIPVAILAFSQKLKKGPQIPSIFINNCCFILFLSAIVSPINLAIGHPMYTQAVIILVFYTFSIFGGIYALSFPSRRLIYFIFVNFLICLLFSIYKADLVQWLWQVEGTEQRVIWITLFLIPIAACLEIPYIYFLNCKTGSERALFYAFGCLGTLVGSIASIYLLVKMGQAFTLQVAAVCYLLLFVAYALGPKVWVRGAI